MPRPPGSAASSGAPPAFRDIGFRFLGFTVHRDMRTAAPKHNHVKLRHYKDQRAHGPTGQPRAHGSAIELIQGVVVQHYVFK